MKFGARGMERKDSHSFVASRVEPLTGYTRQKQSQTTLASPIFIPTIGSDPSPTKLKKTKNNNSLRFSGAESLLKESPSHVMSKAMLVLNPPEQEFKLTRTHLSPKNLHADTII